MMEDKFRGLGWLLRYLSMFLPISIYLPDSNELSLQYGLRYTSQKSKEVYEYADLVLNI